MRSSPGHAEAEYAVYEKATDTREHQFTVDALTTLTEVPASQATAEFFKKILQLLQQVLLSFSIAVTEMKSFALVVLVLVLVAVVQANMFGAGGAFKKKFPGAKPMSYEQYLQIQQQRRKQASRPRPSKPSSSWMFDRPAQIAGQRGRPAVVTRPIGVGSWLNRSPGYSSESDYSREDD